MLNIKYRIVDDIQELKKITAYDFDKDWNQITGFFQMSFGGHQEGSYYHENPLADNEIGGELLEYWFDKLLQVVILLKSSCKYVAFKEVETVNRWLEFRNINNSIFINVAIDDLSMNDKLLITEKYSFSYEVPVNFKMPLDCFGKYVLKVSMDFLGEVYHLNKALKRTRIFTNLNEKIELLKDFADLDWQN